jgi:ubiquinone/menaquinone biosynthesis C-methylase UbiE
MDLSNERPTERFSGLAETYAKHRPTYPAESIDFIFKNCGLTERSIIVDVGCGTGISTRLFAERGLHVIGIEPNDDMRQKAIAAQERSPTTPLIDYRSANAEQTGLADNSVDAVIAAQAFHWFRPEPTLLEFRRILRPGGWVELLWNERDDNDEFTRAYSSVIRMTNEARSTEDARQASGRVLLESSLFVHASKTDISHFQEMSEEEAIGRAFSSSYSPKDEPTRALWNQGLTAAFRKFQSEGKTRLVYRTSVYSAQKPAD